MIFGGIILAFFIFFLRREGRRPANPDNKRMTPTKFIEEVAQYSGIENAEAEKIVDFVFSHFPQFNWRRNLPRVRHEEMNDKKKLLRRAERGGKG